MMKTTPAKDRVGSHMTLWDVRLQALDDATFRRDN